MTRRSFLAAIGLVLASSGLVAATVGTGGAATVAPALDGRALFDAKGCSSCHTGPESATSMGVGPPLVAAATWAGDRRPGADAAAYLAESMRTPGAFISPASAGNGVMPTLALTDDEIDRLVRYLLGP